MSARTKNPRSGTGRPVSAGRRRFMTGAAGLTFGIAVGAPALQLLAGGDAAAATGSVKVNNWVTVFTDGTVAIM